VGELSRRHFLGIAGAASAGAFALPQGSGSRPASAPAPSGLKPEVDGLPPFPTDVHMERRARLRAAMRERDIQALFLGPTLNLNYFTGVSWGASERLFGCTIFADSAPIHWIAPKFEEGRAREVIPGLDSGASILTTWEEWEDPHQRLWEALRAKRFPAAALAVDSHVRATHALRIRDAAAALLRSESAETFVVDALPLIGDVRARKNDAEIARIERACAITQKAIEWVRDHVLVPGVTEAEAAAAVNEAQRSMGLKNPWALVLFGPNAAFPHGTKGRHPLEAGQLALLDCGGELEGYQSDITRTYCIGAKASERQQSVYRVVRDAQKAALAAAKAGVACEEVDRAARKVVVDAGFGPKATYFTHRLGHGIGLEGHEDPYFCEGNKTILAPGMTLSNEPGIYLPGELGIRIEDIVVITDDGARSLGSAAADTL
jgi:Xaa-Pro dipeptidase